jgi:broad specificity phosphatase PhoE
MLLIRHGPSAHPSMAGLLDHAAVQEWRAGYDACGIQLDSAPPAELVQRMATVDRIVCSDLPRTMESASAICRGKTIESSPLLREVPLAIPTLGGIRAPFAVWATAIAVGWGVDILRGEDCPPTDEERVFAAMEWCEERQREVGESGTLAVVTHGVMRRLLATRLCERGWTMHGRRSYDPWSAWELTRRSGGPASP